MALKLFAFVERFMMEFFLLKITQFEKTGSMGKTFTPLGNLIINFHFGNQNSITFFGTLQFCCSIVKFAFFLTMEFQISLAEIFWTENNFQKFF